jgi:hypothetical protein
MAEHLTDPRTIQQQEQQHAERNPLATQRGLQHARHEEHHETAQSSRKLPDAKPAATQSKTL